jgi:hypothetical protein
VPDEIWIGAGNLSPADYLATLGGIVEAMISSGRFRARSSEKPAGLAG